MSVANLGLAVDSSQVTTATKALDNLTAAAKPAQNAANLLKQNFSAVQDALQKLIGIQQSSLTQQSAMAASFDKWSQCLAKVNQAAPSVVSTTAAIDQVAKATTVSITSSGKALTAFTAAAKPAAQAATELNKASTSAAASTATLSAGVEKATSATGLARHELVNLSRQAQDVFVGLTSGQSFGTVLVQQGTQIADVFANSNGTLKGFFGQIASGASAILTPMRLLAGSALGFGAAALYLANSWSESGAKVQRALIGIGAATGATVADINNFVKANSSATGLTVGEAQNAAIEFTKTGNIAVQGLKGVGDAIHGYAILTGQDATDATKALAGALSGDLVKGAEQIDQTYGSMNSATLEYIRTLELQGDRSKAIQVILDAINPANRKAADSVGILTKAYQALAGAMSKIKNGPSGSDSPQDQLAALQARRAAIVQQTGNPAGGLVGDVQNDVRANFLGELDSQIGDLQRKIDGFNTAHVTTQLNKMSKAGDDVVRSIIPQIDQIHQLEQALATLEAAKNTPGVERSLGADDAATIAIQNQIAALREAQAESERYNANISELSTAWDGVSQSTAITLQQLQNQLPVAQAVTAADQMRAQEIATINNLLLQGKSLYDASAIAAKQLELGQAAATSNVLKQVEALKDSTAMMKAQKDGTEATTAASIAYKNAIKSGADSASAAALESATLANYTERASSAANGLAAEYIAAADAMDAANEAAYRAASALPAHGFNPQVMPANGGTISGDPANNVSVFYNNGGAGKRLDLGFTPAFMTDSGGAGAQPVDSVLSQVASDAYTSGGIDAAIQAVMAQAQGYTNPADASSVINQIGSLFDFKNSQTNDKGVQVGNLQSEIALLNTLPDTIARDQKISALTQSINQLRNSTDGLNNTNQELLSPYYTRDPRTSHIGFRSQGMATGGEFTVPGGYSSNDNMLAQIPVASGEIVSVRRPGQNLGGSTSQTVVNITNHITVGAGAQKNEVGRTVYQTMQNTLRQLKAAS